MKKNILSALLLLLSASAMAQVQETNVKEDIIDCGYRWYAQAHINGTFSANEDLRYMDSYFKKSLALGADLGVGYHFNDFWGLYAGLSWNKNRAAAHTIVAPQANDKEGYGFTSWEPTVNVTYNLSNGFAGYKPGRRNNWYLTFGPSVAIRPEIKDYPDRTIWDVEDDADLKSKVLIGGCLGINYVYSFNNWLALTAHATGYIYGDKFNGRNDTDVAVDGRINLGLGLRVYLTKSSKPAREIVYMDDIRIKHDTVRVREEIDIRDIDVYPIPFETNKGDLASAKTADLQTVADILKNNPDRVVYVLGYADKNTEAANAASLAKSRAEVITDALINKYGIDETRVITHKIGTQDQPYLNQAEKNRSTICIITNLKHF